MLEFFCRRGIMSAAKKESDSFTHILLINFQQWQGFKIWGSIPGASFLIFYLLRRINFSNVSWKAFLILTLWHMYSYFQNHINSYMNAFFLSTGRHSPIQNTEKLKKIIFYFNVCCLQTKAHVFATLPDLTWPDMTQS